MERLSRGALAVLSASLTVLLCGAQNLSAGEVQPAEQEDPVKAEVKARLRKDVTVEFKNVTIKEACERLSELSGCKIVVDPSVTEQDKRVTLPKMTISAEHALRWLCHFWRSTYVCRQGALVIVKLEPGGEPPAKPEKPEALQWCDYDISDLVPRPENGVAPSQETVDTYGWMYVRFIRGLFEPETWAAPGSRLDDRSCIATYRNGTIWIRHTPRVQEQVSELLGQFREALRRSVKTVPAYPDAPERPVPPPKPKLPPM